MTTATDTELVALLGGEPDDSGPMSQLADSECDVCELQFYISGYATRGDVASGKFDAAEYYTCDCGGHWRAA